MVFSTSFVVLDMGDSRIFDWVWVVLEDYSPITEFKKLYRGHGWWFPTVLDGFRVVLERFPMVSMSSGLSFSFAFFLSLKY